MSRVKIQDIYYDGAVDYSEKVKNIEIVTRKIVEMIIEKCNRDEEVFRKFDWYEAADTSHNVKVYAESLLKQFEDGFSNTESGSEEPIPFEF